MTKTAQNTGQGAAQDAVAKADAQPGQAPSAAPGETPSAAPNDASSDAEAEKRAKRRRSLMLRSAKVVCETGEYICLVRDVSELGTSLSFLHDVPPDERIILALGNGLTYPIERVWSGKRQAGYRFGAQVQMEEFIHENAPFELRPIRLEIEVGARTIDGRKRTQVRTLDLSTHGAKFESLSEHEQDRLIGFQIDGVPQYLGQVCWQDGTTYGLRFQHPIPLQELASLALRLQPFGEPGPAPSDLVKADTARAA